MKRKRFYKNKNRNTKWTETVTGRPIDFAEKYAEDESTDNKFVKAYSARSSAFAAKERARKRKLTALVSVCCIILLFIGFIGADVHMIRHAEPLERFNNQVKESEYDAMSELKLSFYGSSVPSISLDGSVMLSSVIDEAHKDGRTAVMFDAKRLDGTIGYASSLSAISALGAKSEFGRKPAESIKQLGENDLLPIARLYVYLDNFTPSRSSDMALKKGKKLYRDSDGNTYLDPNNEIAYGYIRNIVTELHAFGISVFVLDGCEVGKTDYFETLTKKLNTDAGEDIKFLKAVNVSIKGYDAESGNINSAGVKNDISKFPKLENNQVYVISTDLSKSKYASALSKRKITAYIID
ncbi:MAG: hypothetical protein IKS12_03925 [Eubacterium sp.]|nr:hypothetical protein [Eubacterium sp.]